MRRSKVLVKATCGNLKTQTNMSLDKVKITAEEITQSDSYKNLDDFGKQVYVMPLLIKLCVNRLTLAKYKGFDYATKYLDDDFKIQLVTELWKKRCQ